MSMNLPRAKESKSEKNQQIYKSVDMFASVKKDEARCGEQKQIWDK